MMEVFQAQADVRSAVICAGRAGTVALLDGHGIRARCVWLEKGRTRAQCGGNWNSERFVEIRY
ncbi:MAG: hypothetical protein V1792_18175 [Pseudomonadota bacterium]